jgi:hypothetical protein
MVWELLDESPEARKYLTRDRTVARMTPTLAYPGQPSGLSSRSQTLAGEFTVGTVPTPGN